MGQAVIRATDANPGTELGASIDVGDSLDEALPECDVVIDFTTHHFSNELVASCLKHRKPFVIDRKSVV